MSKIFDPKIDSGRWSIDKTITEINESFFTIHIDKKRPLFGGKFGKKHLKTVVAIPELLKVLKTARKAIDERIDNLDTGNIIYDDFQDSLDDLKKSIDELDEKHGKEAAE